MALDEHANNLGGLLGNFQSLEFVLRNYLQTLPTAPPFGVEYGVDIYSFPVGAELPLNEFTSFDSLGQLINRFNHEMNQQGLQELDTTIVEIRDALAHGRVSASCPKDHLRLLKFSKPRNGKVTVTFNTEMSDDWFKEQKKRVYEALQYVYEKIKP